MLQVSKCSASTKFHLCYEWTKNEFTSNIYNLLYLDAPKAFQENIFGSVILAYNRYSGQSVSNLARARTLQPVYSGEIFENG